jgi:hypothetical protein
MNVAAAGELHGTRGAATARLTMLHERHWKPSAAGAPGIFRGAETFLPLHGTAPTIVS